EPRVLVGKKAAGSADSRLDLVANEQGAVLADQGLGGGQKAGWGDMDALAVDGLDEKGRHITPLQLFVKGVQVAERDPSVRQQRPEPVSKLPGPIDREGAEGESMKGVIAVHDPAPGGGATR